MFIAAAVLIVALLVIGYINGQSTHRGVSEAEPPTASAGVAPRPERREAGAEPLTVKDLHVPHVQIDLKIDGELDEPVWQKSARVIFQRDGADARPYSDVRFMWGQKMLHVGLYAADHDIVSAHVPADGPVWQGDAFHVVFSSGDGSQHSFDVGPTGTLTDGERKTSIGPWSYTWQSGAKLACDADGTIDQPGDNDEEWVVEMDIPLASLGLEGKPGERIGVLARRCDVKEVGKPPLESPCPQTPQLDLVFDP